MRGGRPARCNEAGEKTSGRRSVLESRRQAAAPHHLKNIVSFTKLCSRLRVRERCRGPFLDRITLTTCLPIFVLCCFYTTIEIG